jgi:hypothetical protein
MSPPVILAIDPGKSGGLCWGKPGCLDPATAHMPETETDLRDLIRDIDNGESEVVAWLEDLPKYTGKNIPGSLLAVLFRNDGILRGLLLERQIQTNCVGPRVWQRSVGMSGGGASESKTQWKNRLKALAQRLYPKTKITLSTSDAVLIWHAAQKNLIK